MEREPGRVGRGIGGLIGREIASSGEERVMFGWERVE